jgi:hypothetical protein
LSKALSSNLDKLKNKKSGIAPINLLIIEFGGAVGTKYYSDRTVTISGQAYEPVVIDWGSIEFILNNSATTTDLSITLANSLTSPISDIFAIVNPEGKVAKVYQTMVGLEFSDAEIIFNGRITSPVKYSLLQVRFDLVNRILDLNTKVGRILTADDFPRSLPDHRGRVIPQVIGRVEGVPAVCVFTAGKSLLRESLDSIALTIEADDGSVFPTTGSWVLVIEEEQLLMNPTPLDSNTLSISQRGYNGTAPTLHTKGTHMYEQQSEFRYQVFDNEFGLSSITAKSIVDVRVNGFLLNDSQYSIDQISHPGQIIFDTYPEVEQEKETIFDNYKFDSIVNDGTLPYGEFSDSIVDDNDSNFSLLNSGQRIAFQRINPLNNINQYKRAFVTVTYFTDREEWSGEIQASVYWGENFLGVLSDPSFDPILLEEPVEIPSTVGTPLSPLINPIDPTQYGNLDDMIKGIESELLVETKSETVEPSSLWFDTKEVNPDGYLYPGGTVGLTDDIPPKVNPNYFTAQANGTIGKIALFQHYLNFSPETWEADGQNFQWIDFVYEGFSFSPEGGGTARISSLAPIFSNNMEPFPGGGRASVGKWEYRKKGQTTWVAFGGSISDLKLNPLYVHDLSGLRLYIRVSPFIGATRQTGADLLAELWGTINDVRVNVEYEITRETPEPQPEPDPEPETIVIPTPVRQSHEVEMTFEITPYVTDFGDLLNKVSSIRFENDGARPGTNLYIKDFKITTESGKYTFEYTDEITATVEGFWVDGTQITTDYGLVNELIQRPDAVFKFLLTWNSIFNLTDLDSNYYNAARLFYEAQKYRIDFAIVEQIELREVLEKLAFQVRTDQYWEQGIHKIKVLEVATAVNKQLSTSNIKDIEAERSDAEDLLNHLEIHYSINYSFAIKYTFNKWKGILTLENRASKADPDIGTRKNKKEDKRFFLDYLRDSVTVSHVAAYYLSYYSTIRKYYTVKCFLDQLELDKHDTIGMTFPLDNLSGAPARILGNTFNMGSASKVDSIDLYVLLEDYTYHKLTLTDGATVSDVIQLALVPLITGSDTVNVSDTINFVFDLNLENATNVSDTFSHIIHKSLFIRDGFQGGFGDQSWGNSLWGGNPVSTLISDELTLTRILAEGTGLVRPLSEVFVNDVLTLLLVSDVIIAGSDELVLAVAVSDTLSITKV